jgi:hypothetical protein
MHSIHSFTRAVVRLAVAARYRWGSTFALLQLPGLSRCLLRNLGRAVLHS